MDMDLLAELENMAIVAQNDLGDDFDEQIIRFQTLFQYSYSEAKFVLEQHRGGISHTTVSDAHWQMVRHEKEAEGYDREAYEYVIGRPLQEPGHPIGALPQAVGDPKAIYLVKLECPLDCPEMIQALGKMFEFPAVKKGSGATGDVRFCVINGEVKATIASALKNHPFVPTSIPIDMAAKNLSDSSFAPTQGLCDLMLPDDANHVSLPTQDKYPVWYFVYGNLTSPEFLFLKQGLSETPVLRPAMIKGGTVKI